MSRPLCPSAPLYEGSQLLGVVKPEGGISLLAQPLPITPGFVEAANEVGVPEARFRFVNRCVEKGCQNWSDGVCGVIKSVLARLDAAAQPTDLPACGIRSNCRWYAQQGADACRVCPQVTYLNYEEA